jgi:hypothetical protein
MVQYRQSPTTSGSSPQAPRTAAAAPCTPVFTSLADKYGMGDMHISDTSNVETQTIEQELQSYITAQLSAAGTDMMKFWEVCMYDMNCLFL